MEKKVTHCPKCQKPTMNGGQFMGAAQFKIKCPWCQSILRITVQPKIIAEAIDANEDQHLTETFNPFDQVASPKYTDAYSSHPHQVETLNENVETVKIPNSGIKVTGYLYPDKQ